MTTDGDSKQGEAALACIRLTWRTGMRIPGSKQRRIHRYRISRGLPTVIEDVIIRVEDDEDPDGRDNARKLVEEWMVGS